MHLLSTILSSYNTPPGKGLPIGNLTSQHCANFYLSDMDHIIKEKLRIPGYIRYMDDFVLWADTRTALTDALAKISSFLKNEKALSLKQQTIGKVKNGLPLLGFRITPNGIYLSSKKKQRTRRKMKEIEQEGQIPEKQAQRLISVLAHIEISRCRRFRTACFQEK